MKLRTISGVDVDGKKVLVRVDYNVPFHDGAVTDSTRIDAHRRTVMDLVNRGAMVSLVTHFGRPKGVTPEFSTSQLVGAVEESYGLPVVFVPDCKGEAVAEALEAQQKGQLLLLENSRFYPGEQKNDPTLSAEIAAPYDVFVMDAFSAAHRANCTTEGISHILPAYAGYLIEDEINSLSKVRDNPEKPYVLILGGAKVSDKIGVIEQMMDKTSAIIIGGGMAFTFLKTQGLEIGKSLYDEENAGFASQMLEKAKDMGVRVLLPVDVVAAEEFSHTAEYKTVSASHIPSDMIGLDIGPETVKLFSQELQGARTVLWNGPMGVFEMPNFAKGTIGVAQGLAEATKKGCFSVVGGGDTAAAVKEFGFDRDMSHVSTGGGASLEFCEGKVLPGIAPLEV